MRVKLATVTLLGVLAALLGCSSQAVDEGTDTAGAGSSATGGSNSATGGSQSTEPPTSMCSAALREKLSLVDEVSTAAVKVLSDVDGERTLYIDGSTGGSVGGQETHPWLYVALATGTAVAVTDPEALSSKAWDLAFKRSVVRTNSGDSGPGQGGAIRIGLPWAQVDATTLGKKTLPTEAWFNDQCEIMLDAVGNLITTFSDWSTYDEVDHVLSAAPDVVFITAGGDGTLYKVAILDYYSTPTGTHGAVAGRYKVRVAPLP